MQSWIKQVIVCLFVLSLSVLTCAVTRTVPSTSYPTIQSAINAADGGDTIIVAPGTYVENINFNGKNIILTSTDPDDPNIVISTIIDGGAIDHVVTFSGSETIDCILTGFTITNGSAYGSYNPNREDCGGGILGNGSLAAISNCIITGNRAEYKGGGLYDCDGAITNCTITDNAALSIKTSRGGGLSACGGTISNCTISGNASKYGGGLTSCDGVIADCTITGNWAKYENGGGLEHCDGEMINCTVTDNTANNDGGGLAYCNGTITNCLIAGNTAHYGGGLANCDGVITNCTIIGNAASQGQGGLSGEGGGGLAGCRGTIVNCIIWSNSADQGDQLHYSSTPTYSCIQDWIDGGKGNITSDPLFVVFSLSDQSGWDLYLSADSPCIDTATNTPPGGLPATDIEGHDRLFDGDYDGNTDTDMGAYEYHEISSEPCINITPRRFYFYAFKAGADPNDQTLTISNSGSQILNWSIFDVNELAFSPPDWLNVVPTSGSLEHDQIDNITLSVDITGLSAGQYDYSFDIIDPAAVNSPHNTSIVLYIIDNSVGNINVPIEYSTIQSAIDAADPNDIIIVLPGTYYENIHFNGKNIPLTSTDPENPAIVESTIIDGRNVGSVVTFSGSETSACLLRGLTITNGYAQEGGGIYGNGTQAAIENCVITDNKAVSRGGGVYDCDSSIVNCSIINNTTNYWGGGLNSCDGLIKNCIISENTAFQGGGGLYVCYGSIVDCTIIGNMVTYRGGGLGHCNGLISNCTISDNTSHFTDGGGLFACDGMIENCTISDNTAGYWGGGLCYCDGTIINCNIMGNAASNGGGGLYYCDGTIKNCTITDNTASYGGGLANCEGEIANCIIWGNDAVNQGDQLHKTAPLYSCIQDWTGGGMGNITSDPLFADTDNGDCHLKSQYGRWDETVAQWVYDDVTSPCIDAGDPEVITYWDPNGTPADPNDDFLVIVGPDPNALRLWQNELWPHGGRTNMGAYGDTPQASMSADPVGNVADLDHDDQVSATDLLLLADDWLYNQNLLDTDLNRDGTVDITDFADLANQWLWVEP